MVQVSPLSWITLISLLRTSSSFLALQIPNFGSLETRLVSSWLVALSPIQCSLHPPISLWSKIAFQVNFPDPSFWILVPQVRFPLELILP